MSNQTLLVFSEFDKLQQLQLEYLAQNTYSDVNFFVLKSLFGSFPPMDQTRRCMCGRPDETLMVFFWCERKWPSGAELTGSMNRRGRWNIQSETFAPPTRTGSRLQRPVRIHLCWDICADTHPVQTATQEAGELNPFNMALFYSCGTVSFFLPPYLNSATSRFQ